MTNVLIVDDHEVVRLGVAHALKNFDDLHVSHDLSSGEEALEQVRKDGADIIIMDLEMPGISGIEATRTIKKLKPDIKIIVMAAVNNTENAFEAFRAGANGFLTKSSSSGEFALAVMTVNSGDQYIAQNIAQQVALATETVDESSSCFSILSERELQIARLLAEGESVNEVATALHISKSTVHTYRGRLFNKLGIHNIAELTRMAIHHGEVAH
jgi:two-component system invasion response regulator UvrY